jgi:hypothetical protein
MISYSSSSEVAAYIFLSILVLVVVGCLLNILYFLIMCLSSRPENDELIDVNPPI